jgi:hypothetical protein
MEPTREKIPDDQRSDLVRHLCFAGSEDLRSLLAMGEGLYTGIYLGGDLRHARAYYVYGVLDELEKAGSSIVRHQEIVADSGAFIGDRLDRNLIQALLDEQSMWIRKLTEVLTEVVLFNRTNSAEHFRHYLLTNELKRVKRSITNANDFYGCAVENYRQQESDLVAQISAIESHLTLATCWYLARTKAGSRYSGTTAKLSSFRDQLIEAMGIADRKLRFFLGLSYAQGYGGVSEQIHLNVGRVGKRVEPSDLRGGASRIFLLVVGILTQLRRMLGDRRRRGPVAKLGRSLRTSPVFKTAFEPLVRSELHVGDYVIAVGHLAQIVRIHTSPYGYRSFRVRFLVDSPMQRIIEEDCFGFWVQKLTGRAELVEDTRNLILGFSPDAKPTTRELNAIMTKTMIQMWNNAGWRERATGKLEAADAKLDEFTNRLSMDLGS